MRNVYIMSAWNATNKVTKFNPFSFSRVQSSKIKLVELYYLQFTKAEFDVTNTEDLFTGINQKFKDVSNCFLFLSKTHDNTVSAIPNSLAFFHILSSYELFLNSSIKYSYMDNSEGEGMSGFETIKNYTKEFVDFFNLAGSNYQELFYYPVLHDKDFVYVPFMLEVETKNVR